MKRITVDMDDDLYEKLRRVAYTEHKPMAEIVRQLITWMLAEAKP